MKIFQIIQKPQARGAELFACQLSEKLLGLGHDVILISIFEGDFDLPFSGRKVHLARKIKNRFWDFKAWKSLALIIRQEKPDIIQANAADTLKFSIFSKLLFDWKQPVIFRNASMMSAYFSGFWVKKFNQFLINRTRGVVSVSKASQQDLLDGLNPMGPILEVIPIGIASSAVSVKLPPNPWPELVHIGGFSFEKNHFGLLSIFERLLQDFPQATLSLIGEGPLEHRVRENLIHKSWKNQVRFLGALANPFSALSAYSILVLPSVIEGLPAVILEAFREGILVVAYGVGGIPEILKNGETGWVVEKGNETKFLESLKQLILASDNEKEEIRMNSKAFFLENFQLDSIASQFSSFYSKVKDNNC